MAKIGGVLEFLRGINTALPSKVTCFENNDTSLYDENVALTPGVDVEMREV